MHRRDLDETKDQETCEGEEIAANLIEDPRSGFEALLSKAKSRDMKKHIAQGKFLLENDQICKNCNKSFLKSSNFSWSCSYHPNKWNGFSYTCCGKMNKFSPGCITSKHYWVVSRPEKLQACTNCKVSGHSTKDCPLDPNTRTGADPIEELKRINKLHSHKISQKIRTVKSDDIDDEGFSDINRLKVAVKEKNGNQEENRVKTPMPRSETAHMGEFSKKLLEF